jgi:hypothetical protein
MRIAGVRVSVPAARLLAQILDDAGYTATGRTISDAIALGASEPAVTVDDCEAMLALGSNCPSGLARFRRELLEQQRMRWRLQS